MSVNHFISSLTFAVLVSATAHAQVATPQMPQPAAFDSVVDAVLNASRHHNPRSMQEDQEALGVVFQQRIDGQLRYGYTVGAGELDDDRIHVRFLVPRNSELVATWRTSGSKNRSKRYFTPSHTGLATSTRLPIYLVTAREELRVFQPKDRKLAYAQARMLGLGNEPGASKGKLVRKGIHDSSLANRESGNRQVSRR